MLLTWRPRAPSGFFAGGVLCAGPPLTPARRGKSQSSHLRPQWKAQDQSSALPSCLFSLPLHSGLVKVGLLTGVGLFSATLTRQVAPGDGWCRQPGLVGPLGVGLAGCDDAQKVLAPGRPHCLALESGDLWFSAAEGWRGRGAGGSVGRRRRWSCLLNWAQEPFSPGVLKKGLEALVQVSRVPGEWRNGKGLGRLAGPLPGQSPSGLAGPSPWSWCVCPGMNHTLGEAHGVKVAFFPKSAVPCGGTMNLCDACSACHDPELTAGLGRTDCTVETGAGKEEGRCALRGVQGKLPGGDGP